MNKKREARRMTAARAFYLNFYFHSQKCTFFFACFSFLTTINQLTKFTFNKLN